jgi:hypothetical protein
MTGSPCGPNLILETHALDCPVRAYNILPEHPAHVGGLTNVLKASLTHQGVVAMRRTDHTTYSLNTVARNSVNTPARISGLTNVLKCSLPHQGVVTMRITDQLTTPFEVQQAWTNKVPKTSLTHPDRCGNAND